MTVKSHLYAKYYFELRALFKDNEKEFPIVPLSKVEAEKLEINSKHYKDKFEKADVKERLTSSFGGIASKPWE